LPFPLGDLNGTLSVNFPSRRIWLGGFAVDMSLDYVELSIVDSGAVIVPVKPCAWPEQTEETVQTVNIDVV
jgi:hypothetical protein